MMDKKTSIDILYTTTIFYPFNVANCHTLSIGVLLIHGGRGKTETQESKFRDIVCFG